ncbi:hypothetical protein PCE1_000819 [Barthelona sp. PCE]
MQDQFFQIEEATGVRLAYSAFPNTKEVANKLPIPLSALFTPLKHVQGLKCLQNEPNPCSCGAMPNPYCGLVGNQQWRCVMCGQMNPIPPQFAQNFEPFRNDALTIEYDLGEAPLKPFYFYIVDTTQSEKNLKALKEVLLESILYLPDDALVGVMSYNATIQLWDLDSGDISRNFTFNAEDIPSVEELINQLHLSDMRSYSRFMKKAGECAFALQNIFDNLPKACWTVAEQSFPRRATGAALATAQALLDVIAVKQAGRVMLFTSGPNTYGDGAFVALEQSKTVRSFYSIKNDQNMGPTKRSTRFYSRLAEKFCDQGIIVDVWSGSIRQSGLYEMRNIMSKTGGYCYMTEHFSDPEFKSSFLKTFAGIGGVGSQMLYGKLPDSPLEEVVSVPTAFQTTLSLRTSPGITICGALGNCYSMGAKTANVSHREVGEAGTCMWQLCGCDPRNTIAFLFDVENVERDVSEHKYLQFTSMYTHPTGKIVKRVITLAVLYAGLDKVIELFDQEAAAVILGRLVAERKRQDPSEEVIQMIDSRLVKLLQMSCVYQPNVPASMTVPASMAVFAQFMFYLRKSTLVTNFNESPDEATFKALTYNRSSVTDSLSIFQPSLTRYNMQSIDSVLLDVRSLTDDCMLLLDTFHTVLIHYGETYKQYRQQDVHLRADCSWFADLIESSTSEAERILAERWPTPRMIYTYPGHSQERFLKSQLNTNDNLPTGGSEAFSSTKRIVKTHDASFEQFMSRLREAVTKLQ